MVKARFAGCSGTDVVRFGRDTGVGSAELAFCAIPEVGMGRRCGGQGGHNRQKMAVCLAGAGSIVVDEGTVEGYAARLNRSRRVCSGIARNSFAGAASTGGACRLVAQRSIHMPHCVYLEAGGGLRVCGP